MDNNSTDNTAQVAMQEINKYDKEITFRVVKELKSGLAFARETGIMKSKYNYIVFCDDDNILSLNYLENAFQIMESNSEIGALGGQSKAVSIVKIPNWFYEVQGHYAVGQQGKSTEDVTLERLYLWGAGLVLRKSAWLKIKSYGFHPLELGRKREQLSSGDDSEICLVLILAGYSLWYSDKLSLFHFMTEKRLSKKYFNRMLEGHIQSNQTLSIYRRILFQAIENRQCLSINFSVCLLTFVFTHIRNLFLRHPKDTIYIKRLI